MGNEKETDIIDKLNAIVDEHTKSVVSATLETIVQIELRNYIDLFLPKVREEIDSLCDNLIKNKDGISDTWLVSHYIGSIHDSVAEYRVLNQLRANFVYTDYQILEGSESIEKLKCVNKHVHSAIRNVIQPDEPTVLNSKDPNYSSDPSTSADIDLPVFKPPKGIRVIGGSDEGNVFSAFYEHHEKVTDPLVGQGRSAEQAILNLLSPEVTPASYILEHAEEMVKIDPFLSSIEIQNRVDVIDRFIDAYSDLTEG